MADIMMRSHDSDLENLGKGRNMCKNAYEIRNLGPICAEDREDQDQDSQYDVSGKEKKIATQ